MVGLAQNLSFILLGEDKSASKTMDAAAAKAEQVTGRIGGAFTKVGGIIGGEFGNILTEVGAKTDEMGGHAAQLAKGLEIGGGVATTAGLALLQFGSAGQQASDQLKAAMTAAGAATSDYADRDRQDAVASGQRTSTTPPSTRRRRTARLWPRRPDTPKTALEEHGRRHRVWPRRSTSACPTRRASSRRSSADPVVVC
jgi:hypothetical protein